MIKNVYFIRLLRDLLRHCSCSETLIIYRAIFFSGRPSMKAWKNGMLVVCREIYTYFFYIGLLNEGPLSRSPLKSASVIVKD